MPFFSIIIPFYNNADTICETMDTVKKQTCNDWECILINDYSEDGTDHLVKKICEADSRFRWFNNNREKGGNICRNTGTKESKGQYLVFLDADDLLAVQCLCTRKDHILNNKGIELLISHTSFIRDTADNVAGTIRSSPGSYEQLIASFIKHNILWTTTGATWEKTFLLKLNGWNEKYPRLQDVELNIRALMNKPVMSYTDIVDSYYRMGIFSKRKKRVALIGFNLLLRDYYAPLITGAINNSVAELYENAFQDAISHLLNYFLDMQHENVDEWKNYFITTLKMINVDNDDLIRVANHIQYKDPLKA